jgi:hypothetical protein
MAELRFSPVAVTNIILHNKYYANLIYWLNSIFDYLQGALC